MKSAAKKSSSVCKLPQAIKYPPHRSQARGLREGEQLAFAAIPESRAVIRDFDTAHRYRKNGAREKVLGAVYTPPRVAAALTRWAVRTSSDAVLDPSSDLSKLAQSQVPQFG